MGAREGRALTLGLECSPFLNVALSPLQEPLELLVFFHAVFGIHEDAPDSETLASPTESEKFFTPGRMSFVDKRL
jgi:hypothetical protein